MDPLNVGPSQLVELVVGTTLVVPFAKWAGVQLLDRITRKEAALESEDKSLRVLVQRVADKMSDGFAEVRSLINAQNLSIRELQIELKHTVERLEKAEQTVESLVLRRHRDEEPEG